MLLDQWVRERRMAGLVDDDGEAVNVTGTDAAPRGPMSRRRRSAMAEAMGGEVIVAGG